MKRIDTKDGLFDDGNHVFGIHGTRVSAEFLNDIQEEIVNVIGARNLDGSKRDQLITAIRNIVKSGGGSSSGSAITQADQDKIDSSYHKLKHFVEDELGIALDAKNDAQLKTAIDSAIAKLQAQLDDIRKKMTNGSTETTAGVAEIATQNEANDGNDDSKIVTPKKLKGITRDLDSRATRIRHDVDRNTADLVTHRTDIQQNTTDIVSNTASIATIITTIKKGITTTADKLAQSFTVPAVLHDKVEVKGEDTAGHYGYAVAMHNDYLAISDPVLQEVVIYHRDKTNSKIFNIEDVHKGKKHGDIFVEDGQVYAKRKDGNFLDIFEYDETQATLTFKKVNTINLTSSYGNSLAINDNFLIVGNPQSKTVLIYKHSGIQWQLVKQLTGGDSFGSSVAVTDKNIIIAEPDNKKIEVFDLNFNKVKTITGGASYSKIIDANDSLLAVTEPDNNILKLYEDNTEIASKTVKADCINVGKGIILATSKNDKKAYLYDFYSKTGWFTTTKTKWAGLPDNAKGYTGYNIAGGQYQLVRPVGTTDTYTKYKGGSWVKNGSWGGVLWYLGSKIGFNDTGDNQWHLKGKRITSGNNFGRWMGLSADGTTVIGSSYYASFAEVYEYKNNNWVQKGQKLATGSYGCAISGDGSSIAINRTSNSFGVFIFTNGKWVQKGNSISENYDAFAYDIFMSGDGLTVATSPQSSYYGYVYEFINGGWKQKGNKLNGLMKALSLDGKTVSVSDKNDIMYVYEFINGSWKQKGNKLNGFHSGLSSDGSVVAVSIAGTNASVYQIKNAIWVRKGSAIPNTSASSMLAKTSSDGETVVFGDYSSATVAIYTFIKGNWQKVGNTLTGGGRFAIGVSLTSDGSTVAISADSGNYIEVFSFLDKKIYIDTNDGKHYYDNKEVTDATKFDNIMETVAPLSTIPDPLAQANRNIKFTFDDIQEQPNKTGNYVSLLGTGTATTPVDITKLDTNFTIDNNYGDACAITTDKILVTNKTDSKLAIYDHLGTKEKDIQLEAGVGSVIDATDTEAVVGSEKANKFDAINLKI